MINYAKKNRIKFLSSPFDEESISLLNKYNLDFIKIPSGEIDNFPYLKKLGKIKKKIILSTGMSPLKEVRLAINTVTRYGLKRRIFLYCIVILLIHQNLQI